MQVNASSQTQTAASAMDGLIADKSTAQSAEEAFAAVLAKTGLNFQTNVAVGYQAPSTLGQAIDRPERAQAKEVEVAKPKDTDSRQPARAERSDNDEPAAKADAGRTEDRAKPKAERADKNETSRRETSDAAATDQGGETQASQGGGKATAAKPAKDGQEQEAAANADNGKTGLVAEAEEAVAVAMGAVVVQQAGPAQAVAKSEVKAGPAVGKAQVGDVEGAETVAVKGEGEAKQVVDGKGPAQAANLPRNQGEEEVEQAVLALGQVAKASVKGEAKAETKVQETAQQTQTSQNDQAALLSEIVGDQGQVKVEVAKSEGPASTKSASALSVGLLAAEAQTEEAVAGPMQNFSQDGDADPSLMQRNPGQASAQQAPSAQAVAQSGVGAVAQQTQGPSSTFQAALAAQQGGDGVGEVQGVQNASTTQGASNAQPQQASLGQAQQTQDAKSAQQAQAAEKPHEAKPAHQAKEILDQVNVQISKAAKEGLDKITVQMRPEALGRVEVQLKLGGEGQLSAVIVADRPETLDALKRDAAVLEKSLADAGFKTDSGSLQFSLRGEQQNNQQQAGEGKQNGLYERGQALDEAAPEETVAAARPRANSRSGVDISV